MRLHINKDINSVNYLVKSFLDKTENSVLITAVELSFVCEYQMSEIGKRKYQDIFDYCKTEFDMSRKTVNSYLDVVNVYFDLKVNENELYYEIDYSLKNEYFKNFTFSALKACIGLSSDTCSELGIRCYTPVHQIEKIKREYKKKINDVDNSEVSKTEDQKEEVQSNEDDKTFDSLSDSKKGINIFENDFIPENSEFEMIFRKDNTLIRGRKRKSNFNLALKMLRTYLENNPEDDFYYGVVKIKKPL